ncbi:MAG: hypothetical protein ACYDBW_06400 [Sulfuricaulis sp.]
MSRRSTIKHALAFLLTLSVVLTPLAPVSAAADAGQHLAHAVYDAGHGANHSVRCDQDMKTSTQQDSCVGQCCACCAHCFSAVFFALPMQAHAHPVQTPVFLQLHSFVLIASHDRPPRLLSL